MSIIKPSSLMILLILPLYAHAEVADKLLTVDQLWIHAFAIACLFGITAFILAYVMRRPWWAIALPLFGLLTALGPAIEPDIAVFAALELGDAYLVQAEYAEWIIPIIATLGLLGGVMTRRWRVTK
jgi:hypothetical protein